MMKWCKTKQAVGSKKGEDQKTKTNEDKVSATPAVEVEEVNNNGNGAVVGTDRGDVRDETWSSWSPPTALDPKLFILFICDVHKMIRTIYWLEDT